MLSRVLLLLLLLSRSGPTLRGKTKWKLRGGMGGSWRIGKVRREVGNEVGWLGIALRQISQNSAAPWKGTVPRWSSSERV